jgi:origin recognition complex subunit 1
VKKIEGVLPTLSKPHIIVIDEVDYLLTKDQTIFYNLFEWVYQVTAKLGLIIIANTMDFP